MELALKRTDYIVIDDREAKNTKEEGTSEAITLDDAPSGPDDLADLKPLSSSELLGLGLKTSSHIIESKNPMDTLAKISQDFPKYSSYMAKLNASSDFLIEHQANREKFLPGGYNMIWMNGMQIDARQMDAFALLDQLRRERLLINSLKEIGLSGSESVSLISHPTISDSKTQGDVQRYDYRDALEGGKVIIWLNDIEEDERYQAWPTHAGSVSSLLWFLTCS